MGVGEQCVRERRTPAMQACSTSVLRGEGGYSKRGKGFFCFGRRKEDAMSVGEWLRKEREGGGNESGG